MKKFKPANKDKFLQIRITDQEKREIQAQATKSGFDSVTAYLMWLVRNSGKK